MKKLLSIFMILVFAMSIMTACSAAENTESTKNDFLLTMQIGNPVMTINGNNQSIDEDGTAPVVIDDRTLLPVRAFVEGIGGKVDWNENSQTATLSYNSDEIRITIGSKTAYLNNAACTIDVTPVIINNRTMLPIRFIAESFGYTVLWTEETQTISITKSASTTPEPTLARQNRQTAAKHWSFIIRQQVIQRRLQIISLSRQMQLFLS